MEKNPEAIWWQQKSFKVQSKTFTEVCSWISNIRSSHSLTPFYARYLFTVIHIEHFILGLAIPSLQMLFSIWWNSYSIYQHSVHNSKSFEGSYLRQQNTYFLTRHFNWHEQSYQLQLMCMVWSKWRSLNPFSHI